MSNKNEKLRRDISKHYLDCYEAKVKSELLKESPKYKSIQSDSEERTEIQNLIRKMAEEGKKKIEVLIYLNNQFSNSKNSKYFETWIDYHFSQLQIKEEKDEEPKNGEDDGRIR